MLLCPVLELVSEPIVLVLGALHLGLDISLKLVKPVFQLIVVCCCTVGFDPGADFRDRLTNVFLISNGDLGIPSFWIRELGFRIVYQPGERIERLDFLALGLILPSTDKFPLQENAR